ncbi:MAG: hypothetical protein ACMG6H_14030 [Acidobacteriota bacterium]
MNGLEAGWNRETNEAHHDVGLDALLRIAPVGTATLSFDQTPATVDTATFTYTVDGVTDKKTISRLRY